MRERGEIARSTPQPVPTMKTRASSGRGAAIENPAPQKRPPGRKGRKRALAEVPANVGHEEVEEDSVRATNHSPEERKVAVQVRKGPLESEDVAIMVARDSPAKETGNGRLSEQQQQQQQQVLCEEGNTAAATGQEAVACDGETGDGKTVGELDCCPLPGLARAPELSTIPDRAAVAGTCTTKTRRATSFVVRQQQDNIRNYEDQRAERRPARCLSMGAAVASTKVPTIATSSSPVRDVGGRAVPRSCDADETAVHVPPSEDPSGCLGSPAPDPAEPAEPAEPAAAAAAAAARASTPRTGHVGAEDLVAALTFTSPATATSTTRRASIPCRRSEKHPAAIRRRPFSVGSSGVALLNGCLQTGETIVLPSFSASSETAGAIESIGSSAAAEYSSGDLPLPASEEPATPSGSTRGAKAPVSVEGSVECAAPLQEQQQPSTVLEVKSTRASLATASQDVRPLSPEEGPSTPHTALLALVDYATSPSASGSPPSTERSPLDASCRLSLGETSTPSSTFCALTALADYGRTVSKPRPLQQPLEDEGCPKLRWDDENGSSPDKTAGEGAPAGEGDVVDEEPEPVTCEEAEDTEDAEEREGSDVRADSGLSLEKGVGVCDEKPPVTEEVQAVELEPAMVAAVPVEVGEVEVSEEESVVLASVESLEISTIADLEVVADAADGAPTPAAAEGACELDELGPPVFIEVGKGVAQHEEALEMAKPDETDMLPDQLELVLGASTSGPSPGVENGEAVELAVPLEEAGADTEASRAPPASPAAVPGVEVAPPCKGASEADRVRPLRRSGRRRSIAALTTPAFDAALERGEVSTSRAEFRDGQDTLPLETALPAPRRSGRRRSIAPRMPPLAAPAPAPTPAPADMASVEVSTPEPLSSAAAGPSDQDNLLPQKDQGNTESLAAVPSPVAAAPSPVTASATSGATVSESSAGTELCAGDGIVPLEPARPPRRSGRRRSIAPKMQTLAAAPASATATADTPVAVGTTPKPLSLTAAGSSGQDGFLLPDDHQEVNQVSLVAAPSPVAAVPPSVAVATTSESPSSATGAELGADEDILPLETARLPRRSGRRRSIAPRMPALAAAPSPTPATTDPPAAAATATPPGPLLLAVEAPSDPDNLLAKHEREAQPLARSGRRRSVAVLRRKRPEVGDAEGEGEGEGEAPPSPTAAAAAAAAAAASLVVESNAATATAAATTSPSASASASDAASSMEKRDKWSVVAAEAGTAVQQDELAVLQQRQQEESTPTSTSTRRRSRRRKSMRGVSAGGPLLQEGSTSRQTEEPLVQADDGGGGEGAGGKGPTDVATRGGFEEEGVRTTDGGVVVGKQGQTAVMAHLLNKVCS